MDTGVKPIKDFFHTSGANYYFAAGAALGVVENVSDTTMGLFKDAYRADPNTFQNAGYGTGASLGSAADFGSAAGMAAYFGLRHGGVEGWMHKGQFLNGDAMAKLSAAERTNIWKTGTKGVQNAGLGATGRGLSKLPFMGGRGFSGGFMKNLGMLKGTGLMAVPMLATMIASPALGFAGHMLDEAWAVRRHNREIKYDNRFFDTGKYDASTFQQVGAAMNNYESKMVSLSRIYHSR